MPTRPSRLKLHSEAEAEMQESVTLQRPDYIWIVAVAHGSRKPGYWKHRVH